MNPVKTNSPLITLLGPTAAGKTRLAALIAYELGGEVISADSRQVFRGMDLGTGKDMADYCVGTGKVPVHLVDIADAGTEYSLFRFISDFRVAYDSILHLGKLPILCGGTGLYLDAVIRGYQLSEVEENSAFREQFTGFTEQEILSELEETGRLHNTTDSTDRERMIRALEIRLLGTTATLQPLPDFSHSLIMGLRFSRENIRKRITGRLQQRMKNGMVEEVEGLLNRGIPPERLAFYGLEYRFLVRYIQGELTLDEMSSLLNTAIHQFAKRQMTWFRRMERNGIRIHWLEGEEGPETNLQQALHFISEYKLPK